MNKQQFWDLIQEVIDSGESDTYKRNDLIIDKLVHRPVKDIVRFDAIISYYKAKAWGENGFADALNEQGFSYTDSGLDAFILWLISQGKEHFYKVLNDASHVQAIWNEVRLPDNEYLSNLSEAAYDEKRKMVLDGEIDIKDENRFLLLFESHYQACKKLTPPYQKGSNKYGYL